MLTRKALKIGGMTCAACAARIERVLRKMPEVTKADVNAASETLVVEYNGIPLESIKEAIIKLGFEVKDDKQADEKKKNALGVLEMKLIISAIFALPLLYIAMAPMITFVKLPFAEWDNPLAYALTQLALTLPIVAVGYKFYTVGFKLLFKGSPNMDSLIAAGTSAAVIYSVWNTIQIALGDAHAVHSLYYESAGVIITLILLGKTLETISKGKTGEAVKKLMGLAPKTAIIIKDGAEFEVPIDSVVEGDIVAVKPGVKIPVDGTITEGSTAVDESMLTGESMPVQKKTGDSLYAATINLNGSVRLKAEKVGNETALSQIIKLVEQAQGSKAPIAKLADIVAGYFVPIVCVIAVITGIAWYIAGTVNPAVLPADAGVLEFSLTVFISVLVIACPCALGLATPTAIMVGTGKGAEYGILIKSGEALETLHKVNTVVFDKTGTITAGKPTVTDIRTVAGINTDEILKTAASAEKLSEHPLGQAIVKRAEERGLPLLQAESFESVEGRGITAVMEGREVIIGNLKLMREREINMTAFEKDTDEFARDGKTPIFVACDGKPYGVIAVADVIKPTGRTAIENLHKMGIKTVMITGDNKLAAAAIARQVGIDEIHAEVLPQDKANEIKKLADSGSVTAMVGDGINDAPALAAADVGIAIGTGTDVAIESAGIVLMQGDPRGVCTAVTLSASTIKNIKQNLFWAFGYNAVGIPIAAGVLHIFGGPLLNPMFAAAAMSLSSVSVLTNALRLRRFKNKI